MFGPLLGRLLGALPSSAAAQLRAGQELAEDVASRAEAAIQRDHEVRAALGGTPLRVHGPVSQATSVLSVNGLTTRRVSLVMIVQGAGGRQAQADVQFEVSPLAGRKGVGAGELEIWVDLPGGRRVRVMEGGSGGSGAPRTIDVEWKRVD